ncbi:hypothetical protein [Allonocardiopsis opalescens]|uniref:hypothetical protein n=1 Tax=Allonocardiopsis opalescens TaxID=1144618 RepID=UPI0014748217|nr:hypothetical protein [Allonocardiopsis opalescens]
MPASPPTPPAPPPAFSEPVGPAARAGAVAVLLHSPLATAETWGALPERLAAAGLPAVVPAVADDDRPPYAVRYVARAALEIAAAGLTGPVLLVAHGDAGPLLPAIAATQRAAHRPVAGYAFVDAALPRAGASDRFDLLDAQRPGESRALRARLDSGGTHPDGPAPPAGALRPRGADFFTEPLPLVQDWPDAPAGCLRTCPEGDAAARQARLRGWPVVERDLGPWAAAAAPGATARALVELLGLL